MLTNDILWTWVLSGVWSQDQECWSKIIKPYKELHENVKNTTEALLTKHLSKAGINYSLVAALTIC